jgi:putative FmdB family regulatory protein
VPTYEFRCRTCDTVFEERRPMAEASAPAVCPDGHDDVVKLLSPLSVIRPGGGGSPSPVPAATRATGHSHGGCACH